MTEQKLPQERIPNSRPRPSLSDQLQYVSGDQTNQFCPTKNGPQEGEEEEGGKLTSGSSYISQDESILSQEPMIVQPLHISANADDDVSLSGKKMLERKLRREHQNNSRRNLLARASKQREREGQMCSDEEGSLGKEIPRTDSSENARHCQSLPMLSFSVQDDDDNDNDNDNDDEEEEDDDDLDGFSELDSRSVVSMSGKKLVERKARRNDNIKTRNSQRDLMFQDISAKTQDTPPVRPSPPAASVDGSQLRSPIPTRGQVERNISDAFSPFSHVHAFVGHSEHSKMTMISAITMDPDLETLPSVREEVFPQHAENLIRNARIPARFASPSQRGKPSAQMRKSDHSKSVTSGITLDEALKVPDLEKNNTTNSRLVALGTSSPPVKEEKRQQQQQQQQQQRQSLHQFMQKTKLASHLKEHLENHEVDGGWNIIRKPVMAEREKASSSDPQHGEGQDKKNSTRSLSPVRNRWCTVGISPLHQDTLNTEDSGWQITPGSSDETTLVFLRKDPTSNTGNGNNHNNNIQQHGVKVSPRSDRGNMLLKAKSSPNLFIASGDLTSAFQQEDGALNAEESGGSLPSLVSADVTSSTVASSVPASDLERSGGPLIAPKIEQASDVEKAEVELELEDLIENSLEDEGKDSFPPVEGDKEFVSSGEEEKESRGLLKKFKKQMKTVGHAGTKYLTKSKDPLTRLSQSFSAFDFKYTRSSALAGKMYTVDEVLAEEEGMEDVPVGENDKDKGTPKTSARKKPNSSRKDHSRSKRNSQVKSLSESVPNLRNETKNLISSGIFEEMHAIDAMLSDEDDTEDTAGGENDKAKEASKSITKRRPKPSKKEHGGSKRNLLAKARSASVPKLLNESAHRSSSARHSSRRLEESSPQISRVGKIRRSIKSPTQDRGDTQDDSGRRRSQKSRSAPLKESGGSSSNPQSSSRRSRSRSRRRGPKKTGAGSSSPVLADGKKRRSKSLSAGTRNHRSSIKSMSSSERHGGSIRRSGSHRDGERRERVKTTRSSFSVRKERLSGNADGEDSKRGRLRKSRSGSSSRRERTWLEDGDGEKTKSVGDRERLERRLGSSMSALQTMRREKERVGDADGDRGKKNHDRDRLERRLASSMSAIQTTKRDKERPSLLTSTARGRPSSRRNLYSTRESSPTTRRRIQKSQSVRNESQS